MNNTMTAPRTEAEMSPWQVVNGKWVKKPSPVIHLPEPGPMSQESIIDLLAYYVAPGYKGD